MPTGKKKRKNKKKNMAIKLINSKTNEALSGVLFIDSVMANDTLSYRGIGYRMVDRQVDIDERITYIYVVEV